MPNETPLRKPERLRPMTECAIMLAAAFVLSCFTLIEMPMGGSVTLASMVPILLVSVKYGLPYGLPTAFLYSLTQLLQGMKNLAYAEDFGTAAIIVLFDYLIPFTCLCFVCLFRGIKTKRLPRLGFYIGTAVVIFVRFVCHFISGYTVWKQWAPEGMGPALYSFLYNGTFLLPELLIALFVMVLLLEDKTMQKLLDIGA